MRFRVVYRLYRTSITFWVLDRFTWDFKGLLLVVPRGKFFKPDRSSVTSLEPKLRLKNAKFYRARSVCSYGLNSKTDFDKILTVYYSRHEKWHRLFKSREFRPSESSQTQHFEFEIRKLNRFFFFVNQQVIDNGFWLAVGHSEHATILCVLFIVSVSVYTFIFGLFVQK